MHYIQKFEKEIRFPSGVPSFPSLLPSILGLFPSRFQKSKKMLSPIDNSRVGISDNTKRQACRSRHACFGQRTETRIRNFYRKYDWQYSGEYDRIRINDR